LSSASDRVELLPYRDFNDLVQLCIKVKQKNLRKGKSLYSSSYSKKEFKREGKYEKENVKDELSLT